MREVGGVEVGLLRDREGSGDESHELSVKCQYTLRSVLNCVLLGG